VNSIYFGGGTPSLFSPSSIGKFISAVVKSFPIDDQIEISLEANPGTISTENIAGFREAGINRLSLGAQSFQHSVLRSLGRAHTSEQIITAVELSRLHGITNLSLDLMYGTPGQTMALLGADIDQIIELDPPHVSAYGLTIEKGTPFYTSYKKGILKLPKEEIVVEMMEYIALRLAQVGIDQYEISNFAKIGRQAKHNLAYWNGASYLGLGAGAHSFSRAVGTYGKRWSNLALPAKYIDQVISHGLAESWSETLDLQNSIFERFFLGLRKNSGVNLEELEREYALSFESVYGTTLLPLIDGGYIEINDKYLRLTQKGLPLADTIIEEFVRFDQKIISHSPKAA
jgi:oxygen-independent coproporphyrinogen-3 oxidase